MRVIDPGQLLSQHEGKTVGAHLLLGVGTDALFFRTARVVSQDASGRDYQLLIPFDRLVNISATSAFFQLMDATGKALTKSGNMFPVLVPSGQPPPVLLLRMTGVASR